MWPGSIVGDMPHFNDASGLLVGAEPLPIQVYILDPATKGFNDPILTWFAPLNEPRGDASAPRPVKHGDGCVLCAIIADNELRLSV